MSFYRNHQGTVYYYFGVIKTLRVEISQPELGWTLSFQEYPGSITPDPQWEEGVFYKIRREDFREFVTKYMIEHLSLREKVNETIGDKT